MDKIVKSLVWNVLFDFLLTFILKLISFKNIITLNIKNRRHKKTTTKKNDSHIELSKKCLFFGKRNSPKSQHNKNFSREYQDMIASSRSRCLPGNRGTERTLDGKQTAIMYTYVHVACRHTMGRWAGWRTALHCPAKYDTRYLIKVVYKNWKKWIFVIAIMVPGN